MKKNELEKEAEDTGENKDDQWEGICERQEAGTRGQEQGLIISREGRLLHHPLGRGVEARA